MVSTPDSKGYWFVAGDGGVFSFGDAAFYGSTGDVHLNQPVVGMAATPDGGGYWLAAADGGIFTFGDAQFHGSVGNLALNAPVTGIAATSDGGGYWSVGADGGVFTFGDSPFEGSAQLAPAAVSHLPATAIVPTQDDLGYWIVRNDGQFVPMGDAQPLGNAAQLPGGDYAAAEQEWLFSLGDPTVDLVSDWKQAVTDLEAGQSSDGVSMAAYNTAVGALQSLVTLPINGTEGPLTAEELVTYGADVTALNLFFNTGVTTPPLDG
jgi:hypothetical protein